MPSITLRDGLGAPFTVAAETNAGVVTPHSVPEIGGLPVAAGNPMPISGTVIAGPTAGVLIDRSLVTLASTSMSLVTANASRRFLRLQAPQAAPIWFSPVGAVCAPNATGCFFLPAGATYEAGGFVGTNAVTCWCGTANLVIAATEG